MRDRVCGAHWGDETRIPSTARTPHLTSPIVVGPRETSSMFSEHQAELERFQQGEAMMLVARDADDDDAVIEIPRHLVSRVASQEEIDSFKAAHQNLRCFVSFCDAQVFAHFRTTKRSSFVHASGTASHAPESIWHQMAKADIAQWAKGQENVADADQEVTADDRSTRPDVVVTLVDGRKIAIEIQYSGLSVNDYEARDTQLQQNFDARVWLLGHLPPHFRAHKSGVSLDALAGAIVSNGQFPLWINPGMPGEREKPQTSHSQILTAWSGRDTHGPFLRGGEDAPFWSLSSLDECALDSTFGILTPHCRTLLEACERRSIARRAASKARKEEEHQRIDQRRRRAAKTRDRWDRSPDKEWITEWLIGEFGPGYSLSLGATGIADEKLAASLGVTCEHWKTFILRHISQAEGWVSWKELCRALRSLASAGSRPNLTNEDWRSLERFVRSLREKGLIRLKAGAARPEAAPLHWTPPLSPPVVPTREVPPTSEEQPHEDQTGEGQEEPAGGADTDSDRISAPSVPDTSRLMSPAPPVEECPDPDLPRERPSPTVAAVKDSEGKERDHRGLMGWITRLFGRPE